MATSQPCDCRAILLARAEQHLAEADRLYNAKQAGYARRARIRAAACGWAAGTLRKARS